MDTTRLSLLLRIRDPRDSSAWSRFDAIYRPLLLRFARARGCNDADGEDVVQFCMTAVHRHITEFDYDPGRGRFKSWLSTIVNNYVRNLRRRRPEFGESGLSRVEDSGTTPDQEFERIWMEEHLQHCLRELREEEDEISVTAFSRYALQGEAVETVCAATGLAPNQLYKLKWRLTRRLQAMLSELTAEPQPDAMSY